MGTWCAFLSHLAVCGVHVLREFRSRKWRCIPRSFVVGCQTVVITNVSCGSSPRLGDSLQLGRLVGLGISHGADVGGMFPQQVLYLKCRGKYWGTHGFQVSFCFPAWEKDELQHSHQGHAGFDVAFFGSRPKERLLAFSKSCSGAAAVLTNLYQEWRIEV